jgi:hypothetical protein
MQVLTPIPSLLAFSRSTVGRDLPDDIFELISETVLEYEAAIDSAAKEYIAFWSEQPPYRYTTGEIEDIEQDIGRDLNESQKVAAKVRAYRWMRDNELYDILFNGDDWVNLINSVKNALDRPDIVEEMITDRFHRYALYLTIGEYVTDRANIPDYVSVDDTAVKMLKALFLKTEPPLPPINGDSIEPYLQEIENSYDVIDQINWLAQKLELLPIPRSGFPDLVVRLTSLPEEQVQFVLQAILRKPRLRQRFHTDLSEIINSVESSSGIVEAIRNAHLSAQKYSAEYVAEYPGELS